MQRSMITTLEFYGMGLKSNMVIRLIIFLIHGDREITIYLSYARYDSVLGKYVADRFIAQQDFMYLENGKIRFNI